MRVSKELRRTADNYVPIGNLSRWLQMLYYLECTSTYLTFSYVVQTLKINPNDLAEMIHRRLVIQKEVDRPWRGPRLEIHLNRQAYAVALALNACTLRWQHHL
jgi:hypothetical protein